MIARLRGGPIPIRQMRPELPTALEKAIAKSLETNPESRYSTALEFADALSADADSGSGGGGLFGKLKEKLR